MNSFGSNLLEQPGLKLLQDDEFEHGTSDGVELASKRIMDSCANTCDQVFTVSDNWRSKQAGRLIDFVVGNLENNGPLPPMPLACNVLDRMVRSFNTFLNNNLHVLQDFCLRVYGLLDEASPDNECERLTDILEDLYNTDKERSPDQHGMIEELVETTGRKFKLQLHREHVTIKMERSTQKYISSAIEGELELGVFDKQADWRNGAAALRIGWIKECTTMNMGHAFEIVSYATLRAMVESVHLFNCSNLFLLTQVIFLKGPIFDGIGPNVRSDRLTQLLDRLRSRAGMSTLKVRRDIESLRKVLGRDEKSFERSATTDVEVGEKLVDVEETLVDAIARLGCVD
jgi:hypothetical protein